MPVSLTDIATAATQSPFASQVLGALQAQIIVVLGEVATTPDHRVRQKFAEKAQLAIQGYATALAPAIANNLPGSYNNLSAVSDTDVKATMASIWTGAAYEFVTLS
jgi:hypothetical protein